MNSQVESIATPAGPQAIPFYVEDLMNAALAEKGLVFLVI